MKFFNNTEIIFANRDSAKKLVGQSDAYSQLLTKFDLQAKIKKKDDLREKDYLKNAKSHLYDWHDYEKKYIEKIVSNTSKLIEDLDLKFVLPETIFLIKSGMHEEGGANGFTRENCIILNKNSLSRHLFEHELFHIISRFNQEKISLAYSILGFKKCNEVTIPSKLNERKITNPDAPFNNHFITVEHLGNSVNTIMMIYSSQDYEGGGFFSYVKKGLVVVEGDPNNTKIKLVNHEPIILTYKEVNNLYEQIGKNTGYNIHQEEVSADHFSMVLHQVKNLPNQKLVDQLEKILKS